MPIETDQETEMEDMNETYGEVTFLGNPLTLLGETPKQGDVAPDFCVLDGELNETNLSNFSGKVRVILAVPSLDTPVCDMEVRKFNETASLLSGDVKVLAVSMDLPFAQARWCGAAGVDNVIALSDHRDASLGAAYGVLIKELRLLCRAVFVVDRSGSLTYVQIVKEIADEPDYEAALAAVKEAVAKE